MYVFRYKNKYSPILVPTIFQFSRNVVFLQLTEFLNGIFKRWKTGRYLSICTCVLIQFRSKVTFRKTRLSDERSRPYGPSSIDSLYSISEWSDARVHVSTVQNRVRSTSDANVRSQRRFISIKSNWYAAGAYLVELLAIFLIWPTKCCLKSRKFSLYLLR